MKIYFRELKNLKPTITSTVIKMNEEIGELNREVIKFSPYMNVGKTYLTYHDDVRKNLNELIGELLDVGQTSATMFFILGKEISLEDALQRHLEKLNKKGYEFLYEEESFLRRENGIFSFSLPKLVINTNIIMTCLKIGEEAGELAKILKNFDGTFLNESMKKEIVGELLDVAQCCVTMLYILIENYNIDIETILKKHYDKLSDKKHQYC